MDHYTEFIRMPKFSDSLILSKKEIIHDENFSHCVVKDTQTHISQGNTDVSPSLNLLAASRLQIAGYRTPDGRQAAEKRVAAEIVSNKRHLKIT